MVARECFDALRAAYDAYVETDRALPSGFAGGPRCLACGQRCLADTYSAATAPSRPARRDRDLEGSTGRQ